MIREWRLTVENSETKELDIQTLYCLLDHCRLGIIIADAKGMILWGNDYYSAMAGFNIKDFIGRIYGSYPAGTWSHCPVP